MEYILRSYDKFVSHDRPLLTIAFASRGLAFISTLKTGSDSGVVKKPLRVASC